jgi:predicted amidohydrolase
MPQTNDLILTLIQADLFWENPKANREQFEKIISELNKPTDILILPEMFTTGFSMRPQTFAEPMEGPTMEWMAAVSAQTQIHLVGSLIIEQQQRYYNRRIWMKPEGEYEYYDKRHLFRMAGEDRVYAAGTRRLIVNVNGWNVLPLICYDLRFPAWARNRHNEYDLLLYLANWPQRRIAHWDLLITARAVENQTYVAAVNRVGKDGNGIAHPGHSVVSDYLGNKLTDLGETETLQTVKLEKEPEEHFRRKFPVWKDADEFTIIP